MGPNFIILPAVALIPLIVGFIWYNPKVMGNAWMQETGMTEEKAQQGNMLVIFGSTYIFSLFLSFALLGAVVHQFGIFQLFASQEGFGEAGSEVMKSFESIMAIVGDRHLTFSHGAFHGLFYGIVVALPILGINALFEQKTWKYIFINVGYWTLSLALMGGVIGQWGYNV
ncbi:MULTISPECIES: DUF1761 domain-containing protein [unclassified Aureispira]|uniref:DUF1761 domain-containing protein n=1 Tax=unclassified Aureispira TaxID=2649989 RepID=UPI000697EAA8|nr:MULTISPECIES: DUF1761 domain-containing protein [unclassified Aureispira]WMX12769.1 DUF1761 domain-containing protein [Aureispira sp. CCB-E]